MATVLTAITQGIEGALKLGSRRRVLAGKHRMTTTGIILGWNALPVFWLTGVF
jgi:hypothetical protein